MISEEFKRFLMGLSVMEAAYLLRAFLMVAEGK